MKSIRMERCYFCGADSRFVNEEGNPREARCEHCRASKRNSDVARTLLELVVGTELAARGIHAQRQAFLQTVILDTQSSGPIFDALRGIPGYVTSEYFDDVTPGQLHKGVRCENLMQLTFADNTFDFVITQDVLEHVADPWLALREIQRVLKPNGTHLCTIPIHPTHDSQTRTLLKEGYDQLILPPVHHGDPIRSGGVLVYTDFGRDFKDRAEQCGFDTQVHTYGEWFKPQEVTWIDTTAEHHKYRAAALAGKMLSYFHYNSVVFASRAVKLAFTGERFLPELTGQIAYEHFHRYASVMPWVRGKRVLDIASGEGYGSARMAAIAAKVTGVDISADAVAHARQVYPNIPNLEFRVGSCERIPLDSASVDVVVSFETIEHIEAHDAFLSEVKRVLMPEGTFVVSTPNKTVYGKGRQEENPFHVHELRPEQFERLLGGAFAHVQLFGQRLTFSSLVWPLDAKGPNTFNHFSDRSGLLPATGKAPFEPEYLIAVCTPRPLAQLPASLYTSTRDELYHEYRERGEWGQSLDRELHERDRQIRSLTAERDSLRQELIRQGGGADGDGFHPFEHIDILLNAGSFAEAETALRRLPSSVGAEEIQSRLAFVYNQQGVDAFQRGSAAEAERLFQQAVRISSTEIAARKNLADLLTQQARYETAVTCFEEVLRIDPLDVDSELTLGAIMLRTQRPHLAIGHARRAKELAPADERVEELMQSIQRDLQADAQTGEFPDRFPRLTVTSYQSLDDYRTHWAEQENVREERAALEQGFLSPEENYSVPGKCWICRSDVRFTVDYLYAAAEHGVRIPNWRERLVCPSCGLNNRLRAAIHLLESECGVNGKRRIYLTEQRTPLYDAMRRRYPELVGSEYLGGALPLGRSDAEGVRNENLTCLTFADAAFDAVLSFEVLEHVPQYLLALKECFRVLRPGGVLFFSAPFAPASHPHIVRAVEHADGRIEHLLPPEYHGDPVREEGCLAFYHFGWALIDDLKNAGFRDARALGVWSDVYGYLGMEQLFFCAVKPSLGFGRGSVAPNRPPVKSLQEALTEAQAARQSGDNAAAKALFEEIVRRHPDNTSARNELALLLYESGDLAGAKAHLLSVCAHAPDDLPTLRNLADLQMETGDQQGAMTTCFRILQRVPDDVDALFGLGSVMLNMKLMARAAEYFGRVQKLRPDYPHLDEILGALPKTRPLPGRTSGMREGA